MTREQLVEDLEAFLRDAAADDPELDAELDFELWHPATEIDAGASRSSRRCARRAGSCSATSVPSASSPARPTRRTSSSRPASRRSRRSARASCRARTRRTRARRSRGSCRRPSSTRSPRGGTSRRMTVVDAHAHVFAAVSERFPRDVHEDSSRPRPRRRPRSCSPRWSAPASTVPCSCRSRTTTSTSRDCLERFPGRFAAIGVQAPGPVDVDAYRRRREASGLQGLRLFALGEPGAGRATSSTRSRCSRSSRAHGDKLWFYGGREQMQLLELALERAAGADGRAEPPRLLADGVPRRRARPAALRHDVHRRRGSTSSRGLARFPRVFVLLHGHVRLRRRAVPVRRPPSGDLGAARRVRAASPAARLRLPVDPRGARATPRRSPPSTRTSTGSTRPIARGSAAGTRWSSSGDPGAAIAITGAYSRGGGRMQSER